jgi:hypothetical protein
LSLCGNTEKKHPASIVIGYIIYVPECRKH